MDESSINDQIKESVSQIQNAIMGTFESQGQAAAYQMMSHAIGMAMLNAVSNQQHAYILKNAVTTAAVKATLKSNPEEAVKLADKMLDSQDIISTFSGLKDLMEETFDIMARMHNEFDPPTLKGKPKKSKPSQKTKKTP